MIERSARGRTNTMAHNVSLTRPRGPTFLGCFLRLVPAVRPHALRGSAPETPILGSGAGPATLKTTYGRNPIPIDSPTSLRVARVASAIGALYANTLSVATSRATVRPIERSPPREGAHCPLPRGARRATELDAEIALVHARVCGNRDRLSGLMRPLAKAAGRDGSAGADSCIVTVSESIPFASVVTVGAAHAAGPRAVKVKHRSLPGLPFLIVVAARASWERIMEWVRACLQMQGRRRARVVRVARRS